MVLPKRSKVTEGSQYLQPKVLTEEFQKELADSVHGSKPYEHGVIHGLLNDEVLKTARNEIFENIHFTEKETDIYKLNQTGDLLNLDGLPENEINLLQSVLKVRDALYSQAFRDVMSRVTGSGPLSGTRFDLSLNNYNKGCHLLAHDDVIGTRVVSFILYLVPPDYDWDPKWGGALELYPTLREGVPEIDPTVKLPPAWNQLSFFKILPGRSFHDVEEVYVDQPRLSIQGWFHYPQKGDPDYSEEDHKNDDTSKSTLAQLSQAHDANDGYEPKRVFTPIVPDTNKEYLAQYISGDILDNVNKLQEEFGESSLLQLDDFLNTEFLSRIKSEIEAIELEKLPQNTKEVKKPWLVSSPPHLRRYLYLGDSESKSALAELKELFKSAAFTHLLKQLTGVVPVSEYVELRRFRPGHDFTLASVSGVDTDIIETVFSVTPAKWEDEVGGYDLVMGGGTDEHDDPAVYRQAADDEDGVLLSEMPHLNRLTVILRDPDLLRFVKFVSKNAAGSRWDVLGQYKIEE